MNDKINGRTPEEIMKGLECCYLDGFHCTDCVYYALCKEDIHALGLDALAYIQQLERERDEAWKVVDGLNTQIEGMVEVLESVKRKYNEACKERDAAVETLKSDGACEYCKHNHICTKRFPYCPECERTDCICYTCEDRSNWKWRGVPQEDKL